MRAARREEQPELLAGGLLDRRGHDADGRGRTGKAAAGMTSDPSRPGFHNPENPRTVQTFSIFRVLRLVFWNVFANSFAYLAMVDLLW